MGGFVLAYIDTTNNFSQSWEKDKPDTEEVFNCRADLMDEE